MTVAVAIDTAGPLIGVAAWDGARSATRTGRVSRGTERVLVPWLREVLDELGVDRPDVIGVGVGPGAFTGVRVGVAAAIGAAMGYRVGLVEVGSLWSRARSVDADHVLAVLDARRGRVYVGGWARDGACFLEPADLRPDALPALPAGVLATGEGAPLLADGIAAASGRVCETYTDCGVLEVARSVWGRTGGDPTAVRPRYLRAPGVGAP